MKKALFTVSILIAAACFTGLKAQMISLDVIIGNRPPAPRELNLMHAEEAKHPNITRSMHDIERAMQNLHNAPDDFGGHKAQAEADLHQAYVSLRKALYFRLYTDSH